MTPKATPTKEDVERAARAMLAAAMAELKPLFDDGKEISEADGVLACVKAFAVQFDAWKAEESRWIAANPDGDSSDLRYPADETMVTCSAMCALILGFSADEFPPESVNGQRLSMLIHASKAMQALGDVSVALNCESFGVHEAKDLLRFANAQSE